MNTPTLDPRDRRPPLAVRVLRPSAFALAAVLSTAFQAAAATDSPRPDKATPALPPNAKAPPLPVTDLPPGADANDRGVAIPTKDKVGKPRTPPPPPPVRDGKALDPAQRLATPSRNAPPTPDKPPAQAPAK